VVVVKILKHKPGPAIVERQKSEFLSVEEYAFDGTKWVAFYDDNHLYKYDVTNPSGGYTLVYPDDIIIGFLSFNSDTGHLVTGTKLTGITDDFDLDIWNMETNERTTIRGAPGSQLMPDASGHLISFFDRELYGLPGAGDCEIRVVDQETGVVRVVLPWNTWYSQGIWGHWVAANNYGTWGDSIILCDLEAGGLVDSEGHVIPLGGPDGGVEDAGTADGGMDGGK